METQGKTRIHPLVAGASIAVIIFSAVGVAAITGYLPGTSAQKGADPVAANPVAAVAPQPPAAAEPPATRPAPKPVQKPARAAPPQTQVAAATPAPAPRICDECGTVANVREVTVKGEGTGLGAVAGGVAGAVIGNQFGHGGGKTVARIAGAAGGAYAGHEIEKHARSQKRYDVVVRMENGGERTVSFNSPPSWRAGDRVRIVDGKLELDR